MKTLPMTAAGYSVLERELKRRIQLDRPRLIERLQEAIADDSNLAENPEYQAVKSEQEINEARIAELEDTVSLTCACAASGAVQEALIGSSLARA